MLCCHIRFIKFGNAWFNAYLMLARLVMDLAYFAGQLVVASLLKRNVKLRLLLRDPEKAKSLFGEQDEETLQVFHIALTEQS